MSQEVLNNLQELAVSIEENASQVEEQISASGPPADTAIVISTSKYRSALERLAQE